MLSRRWDRGGVNLREARIGKRCPLPVRTVGSGNVTAPRIGREEEDVRVTTSRKNYRISDVRRNLTGDGVPSNDSSRFSIDDDEVQHLGAGMHIYVAEPDLTAERLIRTEEKLLTGLPPSIKGSGNLRPSERTVVKEAAVFTRERHTLRDALIDNVSAHLRKPVDVRLTGTKISALNRVVE